MTVLDKGRRDRGTRLEAAAPLLSGRFVQREQLPLLLEVIIHPGDRVCLEGDNQGQTDLLAQALASLDPATVHDLHMVQSGVVLPEHLDVFERGIAKRLDFAYSGPQSQRMAKLLFGGKIELGAVRT